jgi:PAS domain S-box-containing protein
VLEAFPLIAVVTLSEAHVFRNANKNARIYWGIVVLLSAGILVAIFFGAARERKLIATTSEMKQAEEALRRSEERYALVEEATNDGVWDWNRITGEVYLSPRWKNILGYADDELQNTDAIFLDRLHPDDQPIVQQMRILPLEGDRPFSIEVRLRHKDGNYRWVLSRGKTIFDADGRPARRLGTITDVTDRTHAREKLREQVAMLDMAQVFIREVDGQILTWNTGAAKFYGWQSEEAISRVSHELFQTAYPIPLAEINERLVKDGRWEGELEHTCKDGRRVNVASLWVLHTARASRERLVIETNIDIDARKQTEAELTRANMELEARVAERTADLAKEMRQREEAQQTLAQMQKMEAVGQLSAGMAHDFNNLLAVMMGSLEFIAAAAARGTTAEPELIEAALRSGRRGKELVQRLLSFARQMPIRPEPTPANQLILDTLRLLQRTLGASVAIETNLCLDDATILVDRNQLANALVNLALNARDAMPEGGELTIATTCQPAKWASEEGAAHWPTGEEVCIVISDTGTGMTDEVCKRAFEPFFTTKYDGLGSGLGLSMVHGFVAQSGGHIEIDSNPGRGTTITIRLPRIEAASYGAERNAEGRQSVSGDQRVVLLVEDDPDVRVLVAAQLKVLGFRAYAVASGVEAIDLIESPAHIDMMLTDIVLPGGIDGVTLVKEAVRTRPAMGVLCMSGYATTNKHSKWLSVQNIRVLDKPFSLAKLAQALDAISPSSLTDQEPQRFDKLSA